MPPRLDLPPRTHWLYKALIAIILLNALVTAYLWRTVQTQQRQIQTLQQHDSIQQSVDKLNSKYDSLKSRVEGLFH
jgi:cell division protein FtsB